MDESSPAAAARIIQFALLSGVVLFAVVIGVITEALTGQGILHQIGLGTLLSQG
jgi:hypothetical protein